jgi:hypothetical protein
MNVTQLLTFGGGLLLVYSGITGKNPVDVVKMGLAKSKAQDDSANDRTTPVTGDDQPAPAAPPAPQYNTPATPTVPPR